MRDIAFSPRPGKLVKASRELPQFCPSISFYHLDAPFHLCPLDVLLADANMFRVLLDRYDPNSGRRVLGHQYGGIAVERSDLQNSLGPSLLHLFRENPSLDGAYRWDE